MQKNLFPFLIGKVLTILIVAFFVAGKFLFPFLIGKVLTSALLILFNPEIEIQRVSIPYR